MANQYLLRGVNGKIGGYISEDNPMPVSLVSQTFEIDPDTGLLLVADTYWKSKRYDWTSGDLDYKGFSHTFDAPTDAGDYWHIWKYMWVGGLPTNEQLLIGNWDLRAAMGWG